MPKITKSVGVESRCVISCRGAPELLLAWDVCSPRLLVPGMTKCGTCMCVYTYSLTVSSSGKEYCSFNATDEPILDPIRCIDLHGYEFRDNGALSAIIP